MRLSIMASLLAVATQATAIAIEPIQARAENVTAEAASYWLETIQHQGIAAFNPSPNGYSVFRNVKDFGAKGDGSVDDSDAINNAISAGNRCGPHVCQSSSDSPAVVYIPSGTYRISKPIIFYYETQLVGNPNGRPVLQADPSLDALALIDASPYQGENPGWTSTNIFLRSIKNVIIDLTPIEATKGAQGIHWPASQATTIQNVQIKMRKDPNSVHAGIFVENGSGGHMADLEIIGGKYGMNIGNQQFTMRNIKISDAITGISQIWNWGWLYHGLTISNCATAFSMTSVAAGTANQQVGSVVLIDSTINNCQTFVDQVWTNTAAPRGAGQLILENIALNNVPIAVKGSNGVTVLTGGTTTIAAWGQGNKYTPDGLQKFQGPLTPANRPSGLLDGNRFYASSKPQYETFGTDSFLSVRSAGAKGDGTTDDTLVVQKAVNDAKNSNKILFFDHGSYKVTDTIYIPPGSRIVGESYSRIMATGNKWSSKTNPVPVIQIGRAGEAGSIEWSDMIVGTQGPTPGAVLIEYNLDTTRGSGIWDVHTRIGGVKGSKLQVAQCPTGTMKDECMAAFMNVHITKSAKNCYMENNWFWTADHDVDDSQSTRVSVYTGRGLLVEGTNTWLWASGVEHHALYQYQFANAQNIFAGFIQTETPYWQPSPDAKSQPYPLSGTLNDPDYSSACPAGQTCDAYGLRILNSQNVLIYGAGLYSFFKNYDLTCSKPEAAVRDCQNRIFSVEGSSTSNIITYSLNQVGALKMITIDGVDKADWSDNLAGYSNGIGLFSYKV